MKDTSRSLCYPAYVVIVFHLVKQSAKPLGFLLFVYFNQIEFQKRWSNFYEPLDLLIYFLTYMYMNIGINMFSLR